MKKRSLLSFIVLAVIFITNGLFSQLHAYQGIMTGFEGKLRIAKTKYFDIIYPSESEASANILFERADELYDQLLEKYMVPHPFRITVSISPAMESFNALFTCFPYNAILMYDTPPTHNMMVFSETVINTFRHELIHAITYNSKNTFWHGVGSIFGDTISPSVATTTLGFAEGATVSTESDGGEGRMNSEYHLTMIKQAKIEGKFPKYSEIQGARDIVPSTQTCYYFGGAFSEYLQKTYGFQKYAQFWYNATNIQKFSYLFYFANFKKVYGISFEKAWKDFYDSIEIPELNTELTNTAVAQTSTPSADEKTSWPENSPITPALANRNNGKKFYSCLTSSQKGYAWYDNTNLNIYFCEKNGKIHKIAKEYGVSNLNLSPDGRFLAVSYTKARPNTSKTYVKFLDLEKHKTYTVKKGSFRDAAVFMNQNRYYAACVRTLSQNTQLEIYELSDDKKRNTPAAHEIQNVQEMPESRKTGNKKLVSPVTTITAPFESYIYSPSGNQDGTLFFLYKQALGFSICSFNLNSGEISKLEIPEFTQKENRASIRSLDCNGDNFLTFSFSERGTFPRAGIIDLRTKQVKLGQDDISGGFYNPVLINTVLKDSLSETSELNSENTGRHTPDFEQNLAFIGIFFEHRELFTADIGRLNFTSQEITIRSAENLQIAVNQSSGPELQAWEQQKSGQNSIPPTELQAGEPDLTNRNSESASKLPEGTSIAEASKAYSSLEYTFTGQNAVFVPLSIAQSPAVTKDSDGSVTLTSQYLMPLGATYVSASPWIDPIWFISAGYMPLLNTFGLSTMVRGTNNLMKYQLNEIASFDSYGFKNTYTSVNFTVPLSFWGNWYLQLEDTSNLFFGRQSIKIPEEILKNVDYGTLQTQKQKTEYLFGYSLDKSSINTLFSTTITGLSFGNICSRGSGTYQQGGIQIMPFWLNGDYALWENGDYLKSEENLYFNLGLDVIAAIPRLLPFEMYKTTLNLPLIMEATLFPTNGKILSTGAKLVLFSTEIQKSTNFLPLLYLNRCTISSTYVGNFGEKEGLPSYAIFEAGKYLKNVFNGAAEYNDEISLYLSFDLTPNIGGLARNYFQFQVDAGFHYRFNPKAEQEHFGFSIMGVTIW